MSEPRLVSPLLSDHIIGEPISDHFGIRCCPALEKESEEKYIVKIISIPASSRQLDALLLSGAYSTAEEAREYFRRLTDDAVQEAKTLQALAKLEGFWPCDGWHVEPTEDGTGFELYLLSPYGVTLERLTRKDCLTHLAAVNLGLDLCAALSVCRRNGWLYVNLKPENIIRSDTKGFLIGDLGFLSLRSLKYASLPDKYRSVYTAPEIQDAYSTLNTTLDIYAVGRILGQVFNGGILPDDPMEAPQYADPDIVQIIRKACADDPADRWQDPEEMAQALVAYMQSHTVNDTPIIPLPETESEIEEDPTVEEPIEETEESEAEVEESPAVSAEAEPVVELPAEDEPLEEEVDLLPIPVEEPAEEPTEDDDEPEQFVIEGFLFDDDLQDPDIVALLSDDVISDEVSEMLAQADDLISLKVPDPVVAPEAIEVPMPEPILPEPEPEIPVEEPVDEPQTEEEPAEAPITLPAEADDEDYPPIPPKRRRLGLAIGILALILLLLLGGLGGKYYYDHIYLQNVAGITVDGAEDWLTVTLDTQIDNSLLTVTCTDPYGNRLSQPVANNQATFRSLTSGTSFRIEVVISGRHQLTGITTATYTSDAQTTIQNFNATIGRIDGSVNLSFTVQGPDSPSGWLVKFSAPGVPERTEPCSSHSAMITGLEVGKTYTFRLVPVDELYVVGGETTQFTAAAVILAQDLTIRGFENNLLIADWTVPEGAESLSWTVRCYNSSGYDTTFTVTEPRIEISDLDITQSYTLDVKAEGMLESKQVTVSANSVSFKEMLIDYSDPAKLVVFWPYEGTAPEAGWTLRYSVDGGAATDVTCDKNSFTLENLVPGGNYRFEVVMPEGVNFYGTPIKEYQLNDAPTFSGYDVTAEFMQITMCIRPDNAGWSHTDVAEKAYTNSFLLGQNGGFVIYLNREYDPLPDPMEVTFILRKADGTFLRMDSYSTTWRDLWLDGYCELDLPAMPEALGDYTVQILFNGSYVTLEPISFSLTEAPTPEPDAPTE